MLFKELILQTMVSGNYTKNTLIKYIKCVYDLSSASPSSHFSRYRKHRDVKHFALKPHCT